MSKNIIEILNEMLIDKGNIVNTTKETFYSVDGATNFGVPKKGTVRLAAVSMQGKGKGTFYQEFETPSEMRELYETVMFLLEVDCMFSVSSVESA